MFGVFLAAVYCIVDLSAGPQAKKYPVSHLDSVPEGGWGNEYRLDRLALRKIESRDGVGDYYIGVFEVTQRQYAQVMGKNPAVFKGDMRPVENVTWDELRGRSSKFQWPKTTAVDGNLFIGRLRARTGLDFDLPSDSQWEFACRAGTDTLYNNGGGTPDDLRLIARFCENRADGRGGFAEHTKVGSYAPNAWGLYDMHGNVWEWCLDGRGGVAGSSFRMMRGGCWAGGAGTCTADWQTSYLGQEWCKDAFYGFRLAVNLSRANQTSKVSPVKPPQARPAFRPLKPLPFIAPNPIAPEGRFLADPAARLGPDGVMRVFCSHDESPKYYCSCQNDVLSSPDLAKWHLAEAVFRTSSITGLNEKTPLYAPDGIFLDGKWRLFYCTPSLLHSEGVAQSASPEGPYVSPHRLFPCRQFDPSVFQDDDGTLYLYWGQFTLKCARLKKDLSGFEPGTLRESVVDAQHHFFHEGAQAFKRNGVYYLSYSDTSRGGCSCIGYSTAPTPLGPFTYRGVIVDNRGADPCCNNNHGSVVNFRDRWYVFYHRQSNGVASLRKACVEPVEFDDRGLIGEVEMTSNGVGLPLDPFLPTKARLACQLGGHVRVKTFDDGRERLAEIRNGDTAIWRYFDFTRQAAALEVACIPESGGGIEVMDAAGQVLGEGKIPSGDGRTVHKTTIPLCRSFPKGRVAVLFRFQGENGRDLFQLEEFRVSSAH